MKQVVQSIEQWRGEFAFLEERVDGKPIVYLDNAASSQKPACVVGRMSDFMQREYANVHRGLHHLSERATEVYEASRRSVAEFLHASKTEEIVFTRGTTEAVNLVARSWGGAYLSAGDRILLTEMEHHSNLLPWLEVARQTGATVEFVRIKENGDGLDLDQAMSALQSRPKLFAFTHVPNTLGLENPAAELCAAARQHGVRTFVDAAQSVGHQSVDVQALGCDFLAASAHKMCGPSGIGFLYGRQEVLAGMPPWQFGGEMVERAYYDQSALYRDPPARFEAGTPPIIEAAGLGEAVAFVQRVGLETIHSHSVALGQIAADRLRPLTGLRVFGPEQRASGIVAFVIDGVHPHDFAIFANRRGIAVRAGHHCAQPLMARLGVPASIRASFYLYNTEDDVDALVTAVRDAIDFFR